MKTAILAAVLVVFAIGTVSADEMKDLNVKIVCKAGKCVPAGAKEEGLFTLTRMNAAKARIGAALTKAQELSDRLLKEGVKASDLDDLKKQVKAVEAALQKLESDAKSGKADGAAALAKIVGLEKQLELVGKELDFAWQELSFLHKETDKLRMRRINLEVGVFGGGAFTYGGTGGGLVTLALPMGDSGLWTTRLSGGLGVSPSAGLGWIGMGTFMRSLSKGRVEFGPAVLAMGDEGGLLSGRKNWLLAGGAELRLHIRRSVHLAVTPFLGVTTSTSLSGVDWQDAVYRSTACGSILVRDAGWSRYEETRHLKFTGGALVSLVFPLF